MQVETDTTPTARGRSRRWVIALGALVVVTLVSISVANGLRHFGIGIDVAPLGTTRATTVPVAGHCDAALTTAWSSDSKKTPLWAVTIGTNMMGYTPVFGSAVKYTLLGKSEALPGSLCRAEARHRLLVSAWLLIGAVAVAALTIVLVRRTRRSPPTQLAS